MQTFVGFWLKFGSDMIGALISKDKENSAIDFINIAKYKVENLKKKKSKTCFSKAWEYLMETVKKKKK